MKVLSWMFAVALAGCSASSNVPAAGPGVAIPGTTPSPTPLKITSFKLAGEQNVIAPGTTGFQFTPDIHMSFLRQTDGTYKMWAAGGGSFGTYGFTTPDLVRADFDEDERQRAARRAFTVNRRNVRLRRRLCGRRQRLSGRERHRSPHDLSRGESSVQRHRFLGRAVLRDRRAGAIVRRWTHLDEARRHHLRARSATGDAARDRRRWLRRRRSSATVSSTYFTARSICRAGSTALRSPARRLVATASQGVG